MIEHLEHMYQQHWIALPKDVRNQLVNIFGLQRTGISEIRDQTVISDGYCNADLEGITKEKMAEYTGFPLTESFMHLLEKTLAKVQSDLHPELKVAEETLTKPVDELKSIGILPPEEAEQFKKEYNQRNKNAKTTKTK